MTYECSVKFHRSVIGAHFCLRVPKDLRHL